MPATRLALSLAVSFIFAAIGVALEYALRPRPTQPLTVHDVALDDDGGQHWTDAYRSVVN